MPNLFDKVPKGPRPNAEILLGKEKIKVSNGKPIVGERVKRSESMTFKICYQFHKLMKKSALLSARNRSIK